MGRFYGMGQAIGLLGQQLMQQSAAEEARKDKEAMLQETLQQRRDAEALHAQTQRANAMVELEKRRLGVRQEEIKTPYGAAGLSATISAVGGFDPKTTRAALQYLNGEDVAPEQADAARALVALDAFKKVFTQTTRTGGDYKAFEEGENQRIANTGTEKLIKNKAGVNAIAAFNGAVKGSPQYNSDSNLYTGELSAAGAANNSARIAAARASGSSQDPMMKLIGQLMLQEMKNGSADGRMSFQKAHDASVKIATKPGGMGLDDDKYREAMAAFGFPNAQMNGQGTGYSGQGLLKMGVGQAPAGGSALGRQ